MLGPAGSGKTMMAKALPGRLAADIILRVLGPAADLRAALRWIREREQQSLVPVRPIAGAEEFLASVPADRWAVVTSASRSMMVRRLTAAGLPTPRVAVCAEDVAVGKPDPVRTEIVKAYVVLRDGVEPSAALADEIKSWVRERLSAHEYPREVAFVDSMPLTTTGKVIRRIFRDRARRETEA